MPSSLSLWAKTNESAVQCKNKYHNRKQCSSEHWVKIKLFQMGSTTASGGQTPDPPLIFTMQSTVAGNTFVNGNAGGSSSRSLRWCHTVHALVRQDSLRQDSLKHRLSYRAPGFERSCAQNGRKTHWGTSACALASLRHEHRYVWARVVHTLYWKLLYLWNFRPITIISGQISHIFSNLIFIR